MSRLFFFSKSTISQTRQLCTLILDKYPSSVNEGGYACESQLPLQKHILVPFLCHQELRRVQRLINDQQTMWTDLASQVNRERLVFVTRLRQNREVANDLSNVAVAI